MLVARLCGAPTVPKTMGYININIYIYIYIYIDGEIDR